MEVRHQIVVIRIAIVIVVQIVLISLIIIPIIKTIICIIIPIIKINVSIIILIIIAIIEKIEKFLPLFDKSYIEFSLQLRNNFHIKLSLNDVLSFELS